MVGAGAEVDACRRLRAVGPVAEVDGVEVPLEDLALRLLVLQLDGQRGLPQLAVHGASRVEQGVLDVLLRDRRAALDDLARAGVGPRGAQEGAQVDAAVVPEALVLDGDDGVLQGPGDVVEGHELAVLLGVERGHQGPVGGEDLRRLRLAAEHWRDRAGCVRARARDQRHAGEHCGRDSPHRAIVTWIGSPAWA